MIIDNDDNDIACQGLKKEHLKYESKIRPCMRGLRGLVNLLIKLDFTNIVHVKVRVVRRTPVP